MFAEAWTKWTTPDKIIAAFRRVGLTVNGLNPEAIPKAKFVISSSVAKPPPPTTPPAPATPLLQMAAPQPAITSRRERRRRERLRRPLHHCQQCSPRSICQVSGSRPHLTETLLSPTARSTGRRKPSWRLRPPKSSSRAQRRCTQPPSHSRTRTRRGKFAKPRRPRMMLG